MGDLQDPATAAVDNIERNQHDPAEVPGPPPPAPPTEQSQPLDDGPGSLPPQDQTQGPNAFAAQFDAGPQQQGRQGPYNMMPMANALPQMPYRGAQYPSRGQQRYNPTTSPHMMPQMPQVSQYGPAPSMPMAGQGFYAQHPPHLPQYYGTGHMSPNQSPNSIPQRQNMNYYPNQMMMGHAQAPYYYAQPTQYGGPNHYMPGSQTSVTDPRAMSQFQNNFQSQEPPDRRQSAVRGPPRKPRQSGHAIWIGNLPPQTDLMTLVHHVCQVAPGLESLFLISKSNCAFANFKDEATCTGAQQKLHDSKFQSVRLVSRLRKSTVEGAGGATAPTGPAAVNPVISNGNDDSNVDSETGNPELDPTQAIPTKSENSGLGESQQDKFFVLKSLTTEDLELSVRTGIWATQSHNEEVLNNAFKNADNVYLVFSANKSGEYFGYARMISEINEDPEAAIEFAPKAPASSDIDLPKAIPTEATEYAPKGRIIDDSARGTIFWEVDRDDMDEASDEESEVSSSKDAEGEDEESKTWGKPFKLEWLSSNRLPFYRTRGLRNPWNSNREVKIARDGTELEPSVGRRLIGLFNRVQNPNQFAPSMRPPMGMIPGYPHMRPY